MEPPHPSMRRRFARRSESRISTGDASNDGASDDASDGASALRWSRLRTRTWPQPMPPDWRETARMPAARAPRSPEVPRRREIPDPFSYENPSAFQEDSSVEANATASSSRGDAGWQISRAMRLKARNPTSSGYAARRECHMNVETAPTTARASLCANLPPTRAPRPGHHIRVRRPHANAMST